MHKPSIRPSIFSAQRSRCGPFHDPPLGDLTGTTGVDAWDPGAQRAQLGMLRCCPGDDSVIFWDMLQSPLIHSNPQNVKISSPKELDDFKCHPFHPVRSTVDAWVQVACPRLSMDWGSSAYSKPMCLGRSGKMGILRKYWAIE